PNISEKEMRGLYQKLSNQLRAGGKWLGKNGLGQIANSINKLPEVAAVILASRLSLHLSENMDIPVGLYLSERRFAEYLRDAAYYQPLVEREYLVNELLGYLKDRWEMDDINCTSLISEIASLDYGVKVIKELLDAANDEGREVLFYILNESGYFPNLVKTLRREFEGNWTNCFEFKYE
ncbi:MAG: hypothetical protein NUV73_01855, partial [Candidatus Daviesbacteria bacterium]|nr:hypothetical protein [Candidatus Daviesbacteria bacterium]